MRARERMPCQQAAHKNGSPLSFKDAHKSARACPKRNDVSKYGRYSPGNLLIYDPKHIRKSELVNDIPP